ncbi:hypothetical protein NDU88_002205 [Pleurodeles waltl]|uniref:Uncharacterized protein n=1 Tax=Pleurodeles waltl TaxID=8319 RepID=A0AAV7LBX3_PLEWA|nr:hypothetical protein NDU88_002205 [Pleurodeles waltl]
MARMSANELGGFLWLVHYLPMTLGIGNPAIRIPKNVPVRGCDEEEEDKIAEAGNLDIRVPDSLNIKEGLRTARALGSEDAEGGEDEQRGEQVSEGERVTHDQNFVKKQPSKGRNDPATGQDSPKKPRLEGRG